MSSAPSATEGPAIAAANLASDRAGTTTAPWSPDIAKAGRGVARAYSEEPALLFGAVTFVGGFLAQVGPGHLGALHALGTSSVASGLQAFLTRQTVLSPSTSAATVAAPIRIREVSEQARNLVGAHKAEPALVMAMVSAAAAFLLQLAGGKISMLTALGSSGGIALVQGLLTRQVVWSPRTVAHARLHVTLRHIAHQSPDAPSGTPKELPPGPL